MDYWGESWRYNNKEEEHSPPSLGYDIVKQLLGIGSLRRILDGKAALLAAGVGVSWIAGIKVGIIVIVIVIIMSMAAAYRAQCGKSGLLLRLLSGRARCGGNRLRGGSAVQGSGTGIISRCLMGALGGSLLLGIGEIRLDCSFKVAIGSSQVLLALRGNVFVSIFQGDERNDQNRTTKRSI